MFNKLCGPDFLQNVVLVTTRWNEVELATGISREKELTGKDVFFKPVIDGGAQYRRHDRGLMSANEIIRCFLRMNPRSLLIQKEIIDGKKAIAETSAGKELHKDIAEQMDKQTREMRVLQEEMQEALEEKDAEKQNDIQQELNGQSQVLKRLQAQVKKLTAIRRMQTWVAERTASTIGSDSDNPVTLSLTDTSFNRAAHQPTYDSPTERSDLVRSLVTGYPEAASGRSVRSGPESASAESKGKGRSEPLPPVQPQHTTALPANAPSHSSARKPGSTSTSASLGSAQRGLTDARPSTSSSAPSLSRHHSESHVLFPTGAESGPPHTDPKGSRRPAAVDSTLPRTRSPTLPSPLPSATSPIRDTFVSSPTIIAPDASGWLNSDSPLVRRPRSDFYDVARGAAVSVPAPSTSADQVAEARSKPHGHDGRLEAVEHVGRATEIGTRSPRDDGGGEYYQETRIEVSINFNVFNVVNVDSGPPPR